MLKCPKCNSTYREGFDTCADCQVKLVAVQDYHEEESQRLEEQLVFLKNVSGNYQKELITSFLKAEGILVVEKYHGVGGYLKIYSGQSYTGTDLYVHKTDYDKANVLIDSFRLKGEGIDKAYVEAYNRRLNRRRRFFQGFIFITFIIPLIIVVFGILFR